MVFYVDSQKSSSAEEIAFLLNKCILQYPGRWSELVFLCIGSDRVTGDCLGPYIGHQLLEHLNTDTHGVYVYGTLKSPVHALNLSRISRQIKILHPEGLVIAVDASLGQKKHLGYVTIADGALYPGAAVQKELPPVGDIHITGDCKHCRCTGTANPSDYPPVYGNLSGRYHHTGNRKLYKFFDLFVDTFCIKTIFLKKSCGRTGFSEYIIYTDTFYRYRCFLRQAFAYCSTKSADY